MQSSKHDLGIEGKKQNGRAREGGGGGADGRKMS